MEDQCAICQDALTSHIFTTDCGHQFHAGCITGWYRQVAHCPLCRRPQNIFRVVIVFLGADTRLSGSGELRAAFCEVICLDPMSPVSEIMRAAPARADDVSALRLIHYGRIIGAADRLTFSAARQSALIAVDAAHMPLGEFARRASRILANSRAEPFYRHDEQPYEVIVHLPPTAIGGEQVLTLPARAFVSAGRDQAGGYLLNFAEPIDFSEIAGIDDYPQAGLYYVSARGLISTVKPECGILADLHPFDPAAMCDDRLPPLALVAITCNAGGPWPPSEISILHLVDAARLENYHTTPSGRNRSCSI